MASQTSSLIPLMRAIARAHASTYATGLMHVNNNVSIFFFVTLIAGLWNEENQRTKALN